MKARLQATSLAAALCVSCAAPATASAAPATASTADARTFVAGEVLVRFAGSETERVVELPKGVGVVQATDALAANPHVAYAAPNHLAHVSATRPFFPNDPGVADRRGGWQELQWNFLPCGSLCGEPAAAPNLESLGGIDAPGAWGNLIDVGRAGGKGVTVAVVDTGVAYRSQGDEFKRSPDFAAKQFVAGRDFVEGDRIPLDENGHGTHIAGTIAERTNNKRALTGLAYGAKIMPVRVLNAHGAGTARNVASGIEWAAEHGAEVINLSLEFCVSFCKPAARVTHCDHVPGVCEAIDEARAGGAMVVGSAGNEGGQPVSYPGRHAVAVGGATERGCLAEYSNFGDGLDLVAPGGGSDGAYQNPQCAPYTGGRTISQLTIKGRADLTKFGYPRYEGSSMASAHVAAAAALVWARLEVDLGRPPTPAEVQSRLESTARRVGNSTFYGAGLLDAGAATEP
jgi:serine protease